MESRYLIERRNAMLGIKTSVPEEKPEKAKKAMPARTAIDKQSEKMKKEKRALKKAYIAYLALPENNLCNIQIDDGCTIQATTVNHKRRRGNNLMNEKDWEPSCSYCNTKIEENDKWARENGHLKSKFNNK